MNPDLIRAQLLYQQSRYTLCEQEVRRVIAESPHDAAARALLALCLAQQEKLAESQQEADQAAALAPDWAYPHYCRSLVLEHRKRYAEAQAAAEEAIRLDPLDADLQARLAATLYHQGEWQEALAASLQGLSQNAEHAGCGHLRSMSLTKLGRQAEAIDSVESALHRNPDDALAHANKGWALLHQRQPREALVHFREALRIDPNFEYAQLGIVEALKARNPLYRWMLVYFLWMARMSTGARWGVILGGYFGARFLNSFARSSPAWSPWIQPLILLYLVFVLLTWFAYPFFNLLLRFNRFGWYALSADQRRASNWFGACLALFAGAITANLIWSEPLALLVAGFAIGLALPLVMIYQCDRGWPRQAMAAYAGGMAAVGIAAIASAALTGDRQGLFVSLFVIGFFVTPWFANYLVSATAKQ